MTWINFFVSSKYAKGFDGLLLSEHLRSRVENHDGSEAFHCAFDLVEANLKVEDDKLTTKGYEGATRPAFGYVWFDLDGPTALDDTRAFVAFLNCEGLKTYFSGNKGFHVAVPFSYFGLPEDERLCSTLNTLAAYLKKTYPSLDTSVYNANRKFRVLGSKHPKTGLYKIEVDISFALDEIQARATSPNAKVIPIPATFERLPAMLAALNASESALVASPKKKDAPSEWKAPEGVEAFKQCGFLQHARDNQESITEPQWYAALSIVSRFKEGRKQCHAISYKHPGYTVSDTNAKIDQALEDASPRTCENVSKLFDGCARCPLFGKINSPVNVFEVKFWERTTEGKLIPKYGELHEEFKRELPYKTIADMKAVYVFRKTHYEEFTPIEIKGYAEQKFIPAPQERVRQEFTHKVFANEITRRDFFLDTTENKINFRNCVLEVTDWATRSHSAEFGFRGVLPYDYDTNAKCPTFAWWLNDVMLGDADLIKILQEYMGYVIRGGEYKYHKALWLSGSGRNGKSTFLSVLKALIGNKNYSTLSIRQIINDKFSSADLDGKIANFSEETSPEELSDSGPFKNLTGDGELVAQKKYGDPYSFRNRAKLIMTYNEVPELRDLSPGMLSRPIIIPWKKDLTDEAAQDKKLKDKLLLELPGIFNFALDGWKRLELQEKFTESYKSKLELAHVKESSCSALQWLSEHVLFLPIDQNSSNVALCSPQEMYEAYCEVERRFPYKSVKFLRRINEHPEVKKRYRRTEKGTKYFSLMLRTEKRVTTPDRSEF